MIQSKTELIDNSWTSYVIGWLLISSNIVVCGHLWVWCIVGVALFMYLSFFSNSQESMKTSYKDFVLGHEVNDVEEHFRRSLEQFNKRPQNDDPNKDVHQIIVTENTPQHSKTPSPTPQHVQYSPTFIARVPSNGTTVGVAKTQVLLSNGQHHSDVGKQPSSEGMDFIHTHTHTHTHTHITHVKW